MEKSGFQEIIRFAMDREDESIQTYERLNQMTKTPGLKKLIDELKKDEENHKKLLKKVSQGEVHSYNVKDVTDLKITDYLIKEKLRPDMDFQSLLIFAAKKEQKSVDLYSELEKKVGDEELKKLFGFLVQQEKSHKLKLEKEYDKHVLEQD